MVKAPGIRDVAKHAGVSSASVSRAINTPELVKPETLALIERSMKLLDFFPNPRARALASGDSRTIGTVVPTVENSMFSAGITALQKTLADRGYMLILAQSGYDLRTERDLARTLALRGVDGLVLRGEEHKDGIDDLLKTHRIPCVTIGTFNPDNRLPTIGIDNRAAGRLVAEHVISLGHRDIAVVSAVTRENDRARERLNGILEACEAHGVTIPDNRIKEASYALDDARLVARELLRDAAARPTAICCSNDILAYGIIFEAARRGVDVPRSLSVVGIGDLELSRHIGPGLTTLKIPTGDIWARAGNTLVDLLTGKDPIRHVEFDIELAVRGTTAVAPDVRRRR